MDIEDLNEFVRDRHLDYAIQGIEIGDPAYEWDDAHHPDAKCLGGTKTVPLMRKDHAVHGVLQSEVFQYPCIYGWESNYLEGELYDLCKKWHSEKSRIANLNIDPRKLSDSAKEQHSVKLPDGRSAFAVYISSFADHSAGGKKTAAIIHSDRDETGRSKHAVRNLLNRFICTETGKILCAGPLTRYQKARGIDPSNRMPLTNEEAAFIDLWNS